MRRAVRAYRRAGADLPFTDPARDHGATMEGYYWRVVDPASASVLVVLCGVCRRPRPAWATVAVAGHPGGFVRHAVVRPAAGEPDRFGVSAAEVLRGSAHELSARFDDETWVDLRFRAPVFWPRRSFGALGPAQAVPGLAQYWYPVLVAAEADGEACLGGERRVLSGARAYAEKNWGPGFPQDWWWGHADAFPAGDVTVAFAGGRLNVAGEVVSPTALVVRLDGLVLRFAPPLARMRVAATARGSRIRARSLRHSVEVEGDATHGAPHVLPVPDVSTGEVEMRSRQHLAGRLRLRVTRGARTLFDGESPLAGLERGAPAGT